MFRYPLTCKPEWDKILFEKKEEICFVYIIHSLYDIYIIHIYNCDFMFQKIFNAIEILRHEQNIIISQIIIFMSHIHKIYVSSKLEYDVYLNLHFVIHYWCSMDIKSFLFLVSMRKKCLKLFKYFHHCSTTLLIFIFNESCIMVIVYHIYDFAGI